MPAAKKSPPVFTNLGMHFLNVSADQVVLVQVEVNVRGLLAVHGRRLAKSKRGMACLSAGAVRMSLASPADREIAHAEAHLAQQETARLRRDLATVNHALSECHESFMCVINKSNEEHAELARLRGQGC